MPVHLQANFIFSPSVTTIFDPEIFFEDSSSSDVVKWKYDFGDGSTSTFMNEKYSYKMPGTYEVHQTVTNKYECVDAKIKEIKILPEFRFWIPNAFTPNENRLNDLYGPVTIGVSDFKFDIFDRWGQKIFTSNDPTKGWDGKFKGKLSKQDVYVWIISYKNDVTLKYEVKTGHVVLLNDQDGFE